MTGSSSTRLSVSILFGQPTHITVDGSMSFLQMMRDIQRIVNVEPRHMRLVFKKDNGPIQCKDDPDRFRGFRDDRDVQWNLQLAKTPFGGIWKLTCGRGDSHLWSLRWTQHMCLDLRLGYGTERSLLTVWISEADRLPRRMITCPSVRDH